METTLTNLRPLFIALMLPVLGWMIISFGTDMGGPRYINRRKMKRILPAAVPWLVAVTAFIGFEGLFVSLTQVGGVPIPVDEVINFVALLAALSILLLMLTIPSREYEEEKES